MRATPTSTVVTVDQLPFIITDVTVAETLKGTAPGTVRIRQTGDRGRAGTHILNSGSTYLLFLQPFTRPGEDTTNQYSIVGVDAGLYLEDGDQAHLQDTESPGLPRTLPIADLSAQARG